MTKISQQFKDEISSELNEIQKYWEQYGIDNKNGGFVGRH